MRRYLEYARIDAYGALSDKAVGPFAPGLNVVYGPNEAGKSTVASFVGGVLFGWSDARGGKNPYKPIAGERAGALVFADADDPDWTAELSRARNADGLKGPAALIEDIDRETFRTMFSLTSDQLRTLKNTPDMTARLLTAESGTQESPAEALSRVQHAIASYGSRAAGARHSIVRLTDQLRDSSARLAHATQEAQRCRAMEREYRELGAARGQAAQRMQELNRDIEQASRWKARLEQLDEAAASLYESRRMLDAERAEAAAPASAEVAGQAESARNAESADGQGARFGKGKVAVGAPLAALIVLTVTCAAAGALLMACAARTSMAALWAVGGALIAAACAFAVAATRSGGTAERKTRQGAARPHADELADDLLRAQELRRSRLQSIDERMRMVNESFDDLDLRRNRIAAESGLGDDLSVRALEDVVDAKAREREELSNKVERDSRRYGELAQLLASAQRAHGLDDLKLEHQEIRTRLADSQAELAKLLVAQELLSKSIEQWDSRSQPEAYRRASEIFCDMTGGRWVGVGVTPEGTVEAVDAERRHVPARFLSLGTCQQLYLSLRIALLMGAANVGRCVPVLADDILVNFDDERREGAARALAALARTRQVILFTCHAEAVDAMRIACPSLALVEL